MQIQNSFLSSPPVQQNLPATKVGNTNLSSAKTSTAENSNEISPLLSFSSQYELSELKFNSTETAFAYRKDNSLALKARREVDIQFKQERYTIEATLTAESIGLTAKDFEAIGNKPLEISFSFKQSDVHVQYKATVAERKTVRKPEEILQDLVKALSSILKEKGDKNIAVLLDEEAIKLLMQDEQFAKVIRDVINLINILNQLRLHGGERKNYSIKLSGKGAPYIDYEENLTMRGSETSFDFKLTILPPKSEEKTDSQPTSEAVLDAVPDEAQAQAMLNLAV